MYKNLWTQSLSIYSIQYTCRRFTTNTIVKIVDSPTRPELKGSLARVIAHRVSALNDETDSQVLICILHNDEHITLPFSVLKQYNDSKDNTNTSSSIAGFECFTRYSRKNKTDLSCILYTFEHFNRTQCFKWCSMIAIAVMMSGNSNEAWTNTSIMMFTLHVLAELNLSVSCPSHTDN